ncbi:MAG: TIGR03936 family radical SAM-associated protein [Lachnospiraceae bacterium]|nr:TIGR03936 family radical SAM-associated protein [Lachnospiraceae bacterium]
MSEAASTVVTARFRFSRKGPVRYLGHLDMLRYFQKIVCKSGIPAKYSEGFHPHQLMSFAYPLAVGMETEGDYMDLVLKEPVPEEELASAMNSMMHEGVGVSRVSLLKEGADNAMALVEAADYRLRIRADRKDAEDALKKLLSGQELLNEKGKDIRPGIMDACCEEDGIFLRLKSGSRGNVRPADVYLHLRSFMPALPEIPDILRLEIYGEEEGKLRPLIEMGRVNA